MNEEYDWRPEVGMRVLLKGSHPAAGKVGRVIRRETWMGKLAIAVQCDDGQRPGVLRPEQIEVLDG